MKIGSQIIDTEGATLAELRKGTRITGAERDKLAAELRKKYESGQSIRLLAESSGRSYGFVHRILSESGTTLRGRGGATRGSKKKSA
ncbi:putative transcriptional regulator [Pseudofrankia inefficax]|uniref:Putative transcriptional regulator n=1 Tax=Pseudofrankia inefficax (strain DSM 45817 / CECT 9037 / DDB 130130 / EuI1c) TaxID=298654 RepID=E3J0Q8_PSEI1|nr:helix-turn-helix domain-containing protein [Pseudofrankia inefficax]ADP82827.1 putative transcriptional regulator [Pseudofrankia inefficax]